MCSPASRSLGGPVCCSAKERGFTVPETGDLGTAVEFQRSADLWTLRTSHNAAVTVVAARRGLGRGLPGKAPSLPGAPGRLSPHLSHLAAGRLYCFGRTHVLWVLAPNIPSSPERPGRGTVDGALLQQQRRRLGLSLRRGCRPSVLRPGPASPRALPRAGSRVPPRLLAERKVLAAPGREAGTSPRPRAWPDLPPFLELRP